MVTVKLTTDASLIVGDTMSVDVTLGGGTAGALDFDFFQSTVMFTSDDVTGAGSFTKDVSVTILDDILVEGNETIVLGLGNAVASNGGDTASLGAPTEHTVTISDDDSATLSIAAATTVTEQGGTQNFVVTLHTSDGAGGTAILAAGITLTADVIDAATGTAVSGSDYAPLGIQTVTFTANDGDGTTKNVSITPTNDALVEGNETVNASLQNLNTTLDGRATLGTTSGVVTIDDNDTASLSIAASTTVTEQGAAQNIVVTLTTSDGAGGTATLGAGVALSADVVDATGGTATSGTDYTALGIQTVTFNAGDGNGSTKNATITPTNDSVVEGDETVNVSLQNLSTTLNGQAALGSTSGVVTVDDNDTASISIAAATNVTESGGAQNVVVTLTTSNGAGGAATLGTGISLSANVVDATGGTATSASDYEAFGTQAVTFNAGDGNGTTKNVVITVLSDPTAEPSETVNLSLQNLSTTLNGQASLGTTSSVVTILDDDWDYGDAPSPYPTLLADGGARHAVPCGCGLAVLLGSTVDGELDGQANSTATGDDGTGVPDDEEGVVLPASIVANLGALATVTAALAGKLDAWVDFNRDGDWNDAGEQIATSLAVVAGANTVTFMVPSGAVAGSSFARFRVSTAGGLSPTGDAADGEVEDYAVQIVVPAASTAALLSDPLHPGQQVLMIVGSATGDKLSIKSSSRGSMISVKIGKTTLGTFTAAQAGRMVVLGLGGDDAINVSSSVTVDAVLNGGDGNDSITSGGGNSVLIGGNGDDVLKSNRNQNVLIGGAGTDRVTGGSNNDMLIGGTTAHDANDQALSAILAEWKTTSTSYDNRVTRLRAGTGGLPKLDVTTVTDDVLANQLTGGSDFDWFFQGNSDVIKRRSSGEALDLI